MVRQLTLVGVAGGALVSLRSVVTLVETLGAVGDGDSVVSGQVPAVHVSYTLERYCGC